MAAVEAAAQVHLVALAAAKAALAAVFPPIMRREQPDKATKVAPERLRAMLRVVAVATALQVRMRLEALRVMAG